MSAAHRLLIIDDSDHLRLVLRTTLEFRGYAVEEAANGREGLERARAAAPDLILCDIEMPVMNGLEFLRQYRAEFGPATPVLTLTAEEGPELQAALAAGATAVINKPFEPIRLLDEIAARLTP